MIVGICDDNKATLKEVCSIVSEYGRKNNIELDIYTYECLQDVKKDVNNDVEYDLMFMDIEVHEGSGIKMATEIMEKWPLTIIVFITAYRQYVREAFAARPIEFLNKPLDRERLEYCVQRAYELSDRIKCFIYEKDGYNHKLVIRDIYYIESIGRKIVIYTKSGTKEFYGRLPEAEEKLAEAGAAFLRIHQSILINTRYITSKKKGYIDVLVGNEVKSLRISKKYDTQVVKWYLDNVR